MNLFDVKVLGALVATVCFVVNSGGCSATADVVRRAIGAYVCSVDKWSSIRIQTDGNAYSAQTVYTDNVIYTLVRGRIFLTDLSNPSDSITLFKLSNVKSDPVVFSESSFPSNLAEATLGNQVWHAFKAATVERLHMPASCITNSGESKLGVSHLMVNALITTVANTLARDTALQHQVGLKVTTLVGAFTHLDPYTYVVLPKARKLYRVDFRNDSDPSGREFLREWSFPMFEVAYQEAIVQKIMSSSIKLDIRVP